VTEAELFAAKNAAKKNRSACPPGISAPARQFRDVLRTSHVWFKASAIPTAVL
jgi:hypothetical protein